MAVTTLSKAETRAGAASAATMKALIYRGPGKKALEDHPKPDIAAATDAIVKMTKTTICGTDLHPKAMFRVSPAAFSGTKAWASSIRLVQPSRHSSPEPGADLLITAAANEQLPAGHIH